MVNGYALKQKSGNDYKCIICKSRYNIKTKYQTPHESKCRSSKNKTNQKEIELDKCLLLKRHRTESSFDSESLTVEKAKNFKIERTSPVNLQSNNFVLTKQIVHIKHELKNAAEERMKLEKEYEKLKEMMKNTHTICEIDIKKAKKLYDEKFNNPYGLMKKLKNKKGKTQAIYEGENIASVISYIAWNVNGVAFVEVVMLATDSNYERKGLAKFLMMSLMIEHKVVTWAEYNVLDFYKKLGFSEQAKLGWDLSDSISYATHSVFCVYDFSDKDIEYLSINV